MSVTTRSKHRHLRREFMFPKFPPEIVADIISRLTLPDIARCLFVSKAWCQNCCSLVRDPKFLSLHHSRQEGNCSMLVFCHRIGDVSKLYLANVDGNSLGTSLKAHENRSVLSTGNFDLVGSSNGLVCLASRPYYGIFYIYNPLTGETLKLPRAKNPEPYTVGYGITSCGFVFDETSNTYKVFRAWLLHSNICIEMEIHTLGSGTWRRIPTLPSCSLIHENAVLVNGYLHWVDDGDGSPCPVSILAFDIADESYKVMQTPIVGAMGDYCISLCVLDGCLSIITSSSNHRDIWVMENYGVESSWSKKNVTYNILSKTMPDSDFVIVREMNNGSLLLRYNGIAPETDVEKDGSLLSRHNGSTRFYKLENRKFLPIGIEGMPSSCDNLEVVSHVGSLISLGSLHGLITVAKKSRETRTLISGLNLILIRLMVTVVFVFLVDTSIFE